MAYNERMDIFCMSAFFFAEYNTVAVVYIIKQPTKYILLPYDIKYGLWVDWLRTMVGQ